MSEIHTISDLKNRREIEARFNETVKAITEDYEFTTRLMKFEFEKKLAIAGAVKRANLAVLEENADDNGWCGS